jgi:acyl dehydratase
VVETATLAQQALLYRLTGDKHPLHADPRYAAKGGFDRPILHGLCTYGIACKAAVDRVFGGDPSRVSRFQARFAGVVYPGETVVTSLWDERSEVHVESEVKERPGSPVLTNGILTPERRT